MKKGYLILQDGQVFEGVRFGAETDTVGELVFTTGMCGYVETLTDPSYAGQIVMQTYPLIGNYGIIREDFEGACCVKGYVVREYCDTPSNFRTDCDLDTFLKEQGVPGLYGVDTRELTRIIREHGVMNAAICDEVPADLTPIETYAVTSAYYPRLYAFIRKQVEAGRQVYIVCPMVSENDELPDERKAVTEYAQKLQTEIFPDLKVAFVHGKMKATEKDSVMSAFAAGKTDILVSTTVIEVGVDVPNANLMVVENAERFGLSQLHQLRGRVGRGQHQSYCVLVSDNKNEETRQRLKAMTRTADGFKIAEEDLRLRGPGDFFGVRQHGLPGLRVADIGCNTRLLSEAQAAAEALLASDPALARHPATAERVQKLFHQSENSLN